jgi:hypothetical protein
MTFPEQAAPAHTYKSRLNFGTGVRTVEGDLFEQRSKKVLIED